MPTPLPTADATTIVVPTIDPLGAEPDFPELEPGTYRFGELRPELTFELGPGWTATRDYLDGAELSRAGEPAGTIGFARAQVVYEGGCRESTRLLGSEPDELINWLAEHPGLIADSPFPVIMGGHTGFGITVTVRDDLDAVLSCEAPGPLFVFSSALDTYRMLPGETARFVVLDLDDGPMTLIIAGAPDQSEAFESLAAEVLNTLEVGT